MSHGEDQINSITHYIPFIGLMTGKAQQHSPIITRLVEAGIIGAVLLYGTVQILGTDINWLKKEMEQMNGRIGQVERNQIDALRYMYQNTDHGTRRK